MRKNELEVYESRYYLKRPITIDIMHGWRSLQAKREGRTEEYWNYVWTRDEETLDVIYFQPKIRPWYNRFKFRQRYCRHERRRFAHSKVPYKGWQGVRTYCCGHYEGLWDYDRARDGDYDEWKKKQDEQ